MKISDKNKGLLVSELIYVAEKMEVSSDPSVKLYFFSGCHSMVQRVMNIEYHADLVYLHQILSVTYSTILSRVNTIKGGDNVVPLYDGHFENLISLIKDLAVKIDKNEKFDGIMKKFCLLAYSTTGNGFYLMQKGLLKF